MRNLIAATNTNGPRIIHRTIIFASSTRRDHAPFLGGRTSVACMCSIGRDFGKTRIHQHNRFSLKVFFFSYDTETDDESQGGEMFSHICIEKPKTHTRKTQTQMYRGKL